MQADAAAFASPARTRDGDVHNPSESRQQLPECGGAAMAKDRPVAASEYSREPDALVAQPRVTDGVDAAVDSMEATGLDAARNGALGNANRDQLGK